MEPIFPFCLLIVFFGDFCGDFVLLGESLGCAMIIYVYSIAAVSSACRASLADFIENLAFSIDFSDNSHKVGSPYFFALVGLYGLTP